MPTKRGAASAGVANGKIYVTGGANSLPGVNENGIHPARPHNVLPTVEEYDPAANTWKTVRPLLLARNHHVAVGVGDKIYVIGGRVGSAFISGTSNNVDLVEMYDPATNLSMPRTRMPTARSAIGAGVYHNQILVAGGEGQDQRFLAAFKAVEAYDPVLNRWQMLPSMPHPRHGLAVGAIVQCDRARRLRAEAATTATVMTPGGTSNGLIMKRSSWPISVAADGMSQNALGMQVPHKR